MDAFFSERARAENSRWSDVESLLCCPGAAYAALAAADRPGDAFYATVATALAALAILLARPPRPGVEPDLAEAILA